MNKPHHEQKEIVVYARILFKSLKIIRVYNHNSTRRWK